MSGLKFIFRTVVGLVVLLVVLSISSGSPEEILMTLFAAVVCTLGLGMIVIVPVSYMVGLLLTIWWLPFGDKKTTRRPGSSSSISLNDNSPYQLALQDYMQKSKSAGVAEEKIKKLCTENGATSEEIEWAFKQGNQI
jgi:hypothetical protein